MSNDAPRVSIALPVYNGERFLRQAIDSLLAQSFGDFELIITDNGSTDGTESICQDYVQRDPRVRYYRSDQNRGPAWNFNRGFELARGQYFKWAAADDLLKPQFLARCVEVLDRDPAVSVCWTSTQIIDDQDRVRERYEYRIGTEADAVHSRFGALLCVDHRRHGAFEIFGLIRSSALRQTPLFGSYARADSVLLARLALLGRFHEVREPLFLNRDHGARSVRMLPRGFRWLPGLIGRLLSGGPVPPTEWWDASRKGRINFPEWRLWREYRRAVSGSPLPLTQRALCYLQLSYFTARHIPKLLRDLLIAGRMLCTFRRLESSSAAGTCPDPGRPPSHSAAGASSRA